MIRNARVLQERFVPADVEHRHEEINRRSAALDPLLDGGAGRDAFLFGLTGAGKTCVARYLAGQENASLSAFEGDDK